MMVMHPYIKREAGQLVFDAKSFCIDALCTYRNVPAPNRRAYAKSLSRLSQDALDILAAHFPVTQFFIDEIVIGDLSDLSLSASDVSDLIIFEHQRNKACLEMEAALASHRENLLRLDAERAAWARWRDRVVS